MTRFIVLICAIVTFVSIGCGPLHLGNGEAAVVAVPDDFLRGCHVGLLSRRRLAGGRQRNVGARLLHEPDREK